MGTNLTPLRLDQPSRRSPLSKVLLFLTLFLVSVSIIACNPFSGDDEGEIDPETGELIEVGLEQSQEEEGQTERSAEESEESDQSTEPQEPEPEQTEPAPTNTPEPPPPTEAPPPPEEPVEPSPEPTEPSDAAPLDNPTAEKARNLVWAYLSQCIPLSAGELETRKVEDQWFVQAAGEAPDKYGLWRVDLTNGAVEPHNIRARQWAPEISSQCTPTGFTGFFAPTPSPLLISDITEPEQAVTALWATLVNCYPTMTSDDLRATLNPASGEWIITAKPDIETNYGVWSVSSDGTVGPKNRQAIGVAQQMDSGLC